MGQDSYDSQVYLLNKKKGNSKCCLKSGELRSNKGTCNALMQVFTIDSSEKGAQTPWDIDLNLGYLR